MALPDAISGCSGDQRVKMAAETLQDQLSSVRDARQAASTTDIPVRARRKGRSRLVQLAPGPESPDQRDKAGAQRGMLILLVAGGLVWLAIAAVAILLLR